MSRDLTADIMANCTIKTVRKNAIETLKKMQMNIDIPLDNLKKMSKYERYVHNSDSNAPARLSKSWDFLALQRDEPSYFFLSPKQRKELLNWLVFESGQYIKIERAVELEEKRCGDVLYEEQEELIPF